MKKLLQDYDYFIFDFDGTIVKPIDINWVELKREIDQLSLKHGLDLSETPYLSEKAIRIFKFSSTLKEELVKLIKSKEKQILTKIRPKNKAFRLLKEVLRTKGKTVFILSGNTSLAINSFLKKHGINFKQQNLFSLDRMQVPKSENFSCREILKHCPNKRRMVYIGNSSIDEQISKLIKVRYIDVQDEKFI